ncbi:LPS export ABC transporter permease LptF [Frigidibacter sp. ROC022]|uniref:LPS export ABC transporter permease LptF n=1 Tax=Frigidibacter sp. ROC022 TaxID=2971796 RepID=UPI00215A7CEE|nr:LPS export ABC transporter permease LptF [Frigidibacter sp. ROC022]MCR8726357.1 LPS export ABC transporter permease LptF [Frigidibacter sp. ROC022]
MPRFDRYLLGQFMVLFGFFSLILVSIYWVNRAVALFDQLIANGQTAIVFLEFTALSLPNVIRIVLPMAAFAATVYVSNRLASDSELVVVQATGYSPWRLARPVVVFGLIVAALISVLTHFLVPASIRAFNARQSEINQNVTARLLTEGQFLHPADGITFYIREITREGELRDIFLSDATSDSQRTTYTAKRALLVRSDTGPKLVMFDGMAQTLRLHDESLAITRFTDFSYDIGALIKSTPSTRRSAREMPTLTLLFPDQAAIDETGATAGQLRYEGHGRISQALLALVAALTGFSALLVGGFSRFGLWRQILGAIFALIVLKSLDNAMAGLVRRDGDLWPLAYVASLAGLAMSTVSLWVAARPALFTRRGRAAVEHGEALS